jgi:hypothetical protein
LYAEHGYRSYLLENEAFMVGRIPGLLEWRIAAHKFELQFRGFILAFQHSVASPSQVQKGITIVQSSTEQVMNRKTKKLVKLDESKKVSSKKAQ